MNCGGVLVKYKWESCSCQQWDGFSLPGWTPNAESAPFTLSNRLTDQSVCLLFRSWVFQELWWVDFLHCLQIFTWSFSLTGKVSRRDVSLVCDNWQTRLMRMSNSLVAWLNFQWCPFAAGSYKITQGLHTGIFAVRYLSLCQICLFKTVVWLIKASAKLSLQLHLLTLLLEHCWMVGWGDRCWPSSMSCSCYLWQEWVKCISLHFFFPELKHVQQSWWSP